MCVEALVERIEERLGVVVEVSAAMATEPASEVVVRRPAVVVVASTAVAVVAGEPVVGDAVTAVESGVAALVRVSERLRVSRSGVVPEGTKFVTPGVSLTERDRDRSAKRT